MPKVDFWHPKYVQISHTHVKIHTNLYTHALKVVLFNDNEIFVVYLP